jgi:carbonic anhydrase
MIERPIIPSYWPQQSPINIAGSHAVRFPSNYLRFGYPQLFKGEFTECDPETHECQFSPIPGTVAEIEFDGLQWPLKKLHFHSPSEHKLDGDTFPLEVHFVHALPNAPRASTLVVIGVMLKAVAKAKSPEGVKAFGKFLADQDKRRANDAGDGTIPFQPFHFLPPKKGGGQKAFFRYEGSLTTPPYTEQVSWVVMRDIIEVAKADLAPILEHADYPAREAQQLSRRFVLRSFR